jgi:hypothetical protein
MFSGLLASSENVPEAISWIMQSVSNFSSLNDFSFNVAKADGLHVQQQCPTVRTRGHCPNVVLVSSNLVMSMPPCTSEMYSMYAGTAEK